MLGRERMLYSACRCQREEATGNWLGAREKIAGLKGGATRIVLVHDNKSQHAVHQHVGNFFFDVDGLAFKTLKKAS